MTHCHWERVHGDAAKTATICAFRADYLATMDLPAEVYLDTVSKVLLQHALPLGKLMVFSCQAMKYWFGDDFENWAGGEVDE
ncbi:hypothetical protein [Cupriavidus sp. RAF12]|uniref:hypothetical protein n=1 Tax=Cupriavidus sp. RAF12 TaxID=3233050 RepID=UPI003F92AA06